MAKREIAMAICSNCIESFPRKDMYTVTRKMHRGHPEDTGEYCTIYCKDCLKDKDTYLKVIAEPKKVEKKPKKSETKKK